MPGKCRTCVNPDHENVPGTVPIEEKKSGLNVNNFMARLYMKHCNVLLPLDGFICNPCEKHIMKLVKAKEAKIGHTDSTMPKYGAFRGPFHKKLYRQKKTYLFLGKKSTLSDY